MFRALNNAMIQINLQETDALNLAKLSQIHIAISRTQFVLFVVTVFEMILRPVMTETSIQGMAVLRVVKMLKKDGVALEVIRLRKMFAIQ